MTDLAAIRARAELTAGFTWIKRRAGSQTRADNRPATREVEGIREDTTALLALVAELTGALGDDAAGRPFAELLTTAADMLDGYGGGPVADCLRLKADALARAAGVDGAPAAAVPEAGSEVIHASPLGEGALTPCCGKSPFELPLTDRMTIDAALVTCAAVPSGETRAGSGAETR